MSSQEAGERDLSLEPPILQTEPGSEYAPSARKWQGIPSIERTPNGRLWAVWYSGGEGEGPDNYVLLAMSEDDGHTWSEPRAVIDPPGKVRAYDSNLWHDPLGRLWWFWAQSYELYDGRAGVWAARCEGPESSSPTWSEPRRICNGVMMNKPVVLSTGEWVLPAAVWERDPKREELAAERLSSMVCSEDEGRTWARRGGADVPDRAFDEHMVIERQDGSLWMLVRAKYGIGESVSTDRGVTWTPGKPSAIAGPNSRFFARRLRSGRLLLVNHYQFTGRSHLTALLSEDDGQTWIEGLLLDERSNVSYPDGVETEDGRIYVIYDRERHGDREILMAVFQEQDILEGQCVSGEARLKQIVSRLGPPS